MDRRANSYSEFWPIYLEKHRKSPNRALHLLGTGAAVLLLAAGVATLDWRLLAAGVVAGCGFAWIGHAVIERNPPATFTHPLWSLVSDLRMFGLYLTGRLDSELKRHGRD